MLIIDWSSDVCSSDLPLRPAALERRAARAAAAGRVHRRGRGQRADRTGRLDDVSPGVRLDEPARRRLCFDQRLAAALPRRNLCRTAAAHRSEEPTSELQSLMRISYSVLRLQKNNNQQIYQNTHHNNI